MTGLILDSESSCGSTCAEPPALSIGVGGFYFFANAHGSLENAALSACAPASTSLR
jgi:hypothetical protein